MPLDLAQFSSKHWAIKIRRAIEVLRNVERMQKQSSASFWFLRDRRKEVFFINETLTAALQSVFKAFRLHSSELLPLMQASLNSSDAQYPLALRLEVQLKSELLRIGEMLAEIPWWDRWLAFFLRRRSQGKVLRPYLAFLTQSEQDIRELSSGAIAVHDNLYALKHYLEWYPEYTVRIVSITVVSFLNSIVSWISFK